ncbi:MAG TPA: hypothetical protein VLC09_08855, partial [Polyangiaceae bacterium]|nr:hypothetical protein [Polyangiaceae bacterium]
MAEGGGSGGTSAGSGGQTSAGGGGADGTGGVVDVDAPFDLTLEENSPAVCGHLATVETEVPGYGGAGYLVSPELWGVGVSWIVEVPDRGAATQPFELGLRYASTTGRSVQLRIDHEAVETVELPASAGAFRTEGWRVWLTPGLHHVSFVGEETPGLVS